MSRKKPLPTHIINNIYKELTSSTPLNKTFAILNTITSGNYYNSSNNRKTLLAEYDKLVSDLSGKDYAEFKSHLPMETIISLFECRENRKIAYSTLALLIEYSSKRDLDIYNRFERLVMDLNYNGKSKFAEYLYILFDIKWKLTKDIELLEDFYIEHFIRVHQWHLNLSNILNVSWRVKQFDKRRLLQYVINARPFSSDQLVIDTMISHHPELKKYLILM